MILFYFSVRCSTIDTPSSGIIDIATNGTTSVAVISCADGYLLAGNSTRTCGEDGQWDSVEHICSKFSTESGKLENIPRNKYVPY